MTDTKTKMKNLINASLFLDETKRKALFSTLEKIDANQQEDLIKILQSEKVNLKASLKKIIHNSEEISELENLFLRMTGKFSKAKEEKSQDSDTKNADELFNQLENL